MGQVRHDSATTTDAVRAGMQRSQASLTLLSRELGIDPTTGAMWGNRAMVEDLKTGPMEPRATAKLLAEDAVILLECLKANEEGRMAFGEALAQFQNMVRARRAAEVSIPILWDGSGFDRHMAARRAEEAKDVTPE